MFQRAADAPVLAALQLAAPTLNAFKDRADITSSKKLWYHITIQSTH
jgi:hypothetical protein